MKRRILLCSCLALLLILSGCGKDSSEQALEEVEDVHLAEEGSDEETIIEPLTLKSFEEIDEAKEKVDDQYDYYNLNDLEYYYIPSEQVLKAFSYYKLDLIYIEDRSISIYYRLSETDLTAIENADEQEAARISGALKLEWIRNAVGEELLKNTVDQLNLTPLNEDSRFYYSDIVYPADSKTVLARSLYWVQEGYLFTMDIPIGVFGKWLEAWTQEAPEGELALVEKTAVLK